MNDDFLDLWAQWGVLNFERYQFVPNEYGDLQNAWKKSIPHFLRNLVLVSKRQNAFLKYAKCSIK